MVVNLKNASSSLLAHAEKAFARGFAGIIELKPDDGSSVWVDGRADQAIASTTQPKNQTPDCVWRGAPDALIQALESEKALDSAYLSGRLFISGDMSVMTRLSMAAKR